MAETTVDFDKDLLLVTAASAVNLEALRKRLASQYPEAEVVQAHFAHPRACKDLFDGVTAALMITSGFHPHETQCGINMIDAALNNFRYGGPVKHMLYSSVIFPILRKLLNHDDERYVEEYLVEPGLPYTIIQPTHLMETFPIAKVIAGEHNVHPALWDPKIMFSYVSCIDVGETAAKVLNQREKHYNATDQLVGTAVPLSYNRAIQIVNEKTGKQVKLERKSLEQATEIFATTAVGWKPEPEREAMESGAVRMFLYYNERGLVGNSNALEMLLGRKPLGYKDWVQQNTDKQNP